MLQNRINIPKAARLRVMALVEATRRRMEVIAHQNAITVADEVQRNMLDSNQLGTVAMELYDDEEEMDLSDEDEEEEANLKKADGYFMKKSDLNRAWDKKAKLMEKRRLKMLAAGARREKPKKIHSEETKAKIAAILK